MLGFVGWGGINGTSIRNLVLIMAAIAALPLAIWRSKVAERQAETAQRCLLKERYQKGAEMLGSDVFTVRFGGIYALARLARENPGDYHTQIMSLLCAFVCHQNREAGDVAEPINGGSSTQIAESNSGSDEARNDPPLQARLGADVQEAMTVVRERSEAQIEIEQEEGYRLNLRGAYLLRRADARRKSDSGNSDRRKADSLQFWRTQS